MFSANFERLAHQVASAARLTGDQGVKFHAVTNFHPRALEGSFWHP